MFVPPFAFAAAAVAANAARAGVLPAAGGARAGAVAAVALPADLTLLGGTIDAPLLPAARAHLFVLVAAITGADGAVTGAEDAACAEANGALPRAALAAVGAALVAPPGGVTRAALLPARETRHGLRNLLLDVRDRFLQSPEPPVDRREGDRAAGVVARDLMRRNAGRETHPRAGLAVAVDVGITQRGGSTGPVTALAAAVAVRLWIAHPRAPRVVTVHVLPDVLPPDRLPARAARRQDKDAVGEVRGDADAWAGPTASRDGLGARHRNAPLLVRLQLRSRPTPAGVAAVGAVHVFHMQGCDGAGPLARAVVAVGVLLAAADPAAVPAVRVARLVLAPHRGSTYGARGLGVRAARGEVHRDVAAGPVPPAPRRLLWAEHGEAVELPRHEPRGFAGNADGEPVFRALPGLPWARRKAVDVGPADHVVVAALQHYGVDEPA